ncbi:hypothetical protein AgCh_039594 [Apium graveolens]
MYNAREMDSLLFSSNFRYATAPDFTKTKVIMQNNCRGNDYETTEFKELSKDSKLELQSCDLTGYQSGPSTTSFLDNHCTETVGGFGGAEYLDKNTLNIEEMDFNARFGFGDADIKGSKEEVARNNSADLVYEADGDVVTSGTGNMLRNNMNEAKIKKNISSANCSNLIRQSSSPAGFFSYLANEIGFTETNDVGNFRSGSKTITELNSTSSRLGNYIDISSGLSSHSRFMPQIAETLNENIKSSDGYLGNRQDGGISNRPCVPNFLNDSTCNSLKRNRDGEVKMLSNLNELDTQAYQNDDSKHYTSGLVHQLSLPNTFAEMATMENFMNFQQDSTPCKIRAKRGFATHPRSIAERVRRTRISARMKKLQDLFPNMDKQANTADMLDVAVVCIKDLQKEVQVNLKVLSHS